MPENIVNLEDLVRECVNNFSLTPAEETAARDLQASDITWNRLRIKHGKTTYYDHVQEAVPKSHVLATSYISNKTNQVQEFNLISERKTKSICSISMSKTFTIGSEVNITVSPPNAVIEANAGFKGEKCVKDSNVETFEETMTWSINNKINVPARSTMKAELVMTEEDFSSKFQCLTKVKGVVRVKLRRKKDNTVLTSLEIDAQHLFLPEHGFICKGNVFEFTSEGACKCRYGIEQTVKLTQLPEICATAP